MIEILKKFDNGVYIFFVFFLVILDIILKILAYDNLSTEQVISIIPHIVDLRLYINPKPFQYLIIGNKDVLTTTDVWGTFLASFMIPILFITYRILKYTCSNYYKKFLIFGFVFTIYWITTSFLADFLSNDYIISHKITVLCALFCNVLMLFTFGFFVTNRYLKLIILLISVTNLSNIISFIYPPFRVVDYMIFFENNRIINLADLCGMTGTLFVFASPFYVLTRYLKE